MSDPPRAAPQAEQPVTRSGNRYYTRKKSPATPTSESPTATVETGLLNFDSTPWSLVSCDGKALGQTPLMGTKLSAGTHLLTLRNPDLGLETQYTVLIEAGKTVSRRVGLQ
jgi:serine/threonine-protein kinase